MEPTSHPGAGTGTASINPSSSTNSVGNAEFVGFLSNYEVFAYLKELKDSGSLSLSTQNKKNQAQHHPHRKDTHLPTLVYETLKYFEEHNSPCLTQSKESIFNFINKIQPYKLTKAEKLTILNTRPTKPVDIQAIVEESEERLTEDQVNEIIGIVEETLPEPQIPGGGAGALKGEQDSE